MIWLRNGFNLLAQRGYISSLQTFGAILDGEFHLLAFGKVSVTLCCDSREVNKNIWASLAGDETIAFVAVEPLDCADDTF